ncbi:adhesion G protein-coupled receptor B2 [Trichonephila clavipes]|nr:adhesion G protein-coupled receptor B2 [Trichonephila clavipes]
MTKRAFRLCEKNVLATATLTTKHDMNDTALEAKSITKCFKMSVEECGISVTAETHGHSSLNVVSIETLYRVFFVTLHFKYDFQHMTATAGSDVVQSGRPIFDDFFQHLWPYIGNNTANVVFQMVKRL